MSPSGTVTVHEARAARATRAVLGLEARPQCHLKIRPLAPKTIAARRRCQAASQPSPRSLRRSTLQLIQLEAIKHRLRVGPPLPFNVRQADHTLLLARGQVVGSATQMEALFERGMLVDMAELETPRDRIMKLPRKLLPALWERSIYRAGQALRALPNDGFETVLDGVAEPWWRWSSATPTSRSSRCCASTAAIPRSTA